ncbi:hypothetical protein VNI00_008830 [Paramarasmius palmivorus]|uniref:P-loop containing nucleoside triphosphate hydrolase protein n=1 Tax=Paramarasmius palmivorus TaxID=297713 RepID=A0AAW0CSH7_9AGAR
MFYVHLDAIVSKARKTLHLPLEELPPLADDDMANNLKEKHFKHIDPRQHIFFWLLHIFRWDYIVMVIMLQVKGIMVFVSPLVMNQILAYIQTPDDHHFIRPWFWIIMLLFAPLIETAAVNWFEFLAQRTLVRIESLLTELLFEHALKIRVKTTAETDDEDGEKKTSNASGKLSTLVTVDLNTIAQSADCALLFTYCPVQIILSAVFLYMLLGWSAFVGIGLTLVTFPIPSILLGWIHQVKVEQMKKTDARVQVFSDAMNMLKMVKLFGWERRMFAKVDEKRNEELTLVKKAKLIDVVYDVLSSATSAITIVTTLACYVCPLTLTLVARNVLTASIIFPALIIFENLKRYIQIAFFYTTVAVGAKVSLDRVDEFLRDSELLDEYTDTKIISDENVERIGFHNALFTWTAQVDSAIDSDYTPGRQRFVLQVRDEILFKSGAMNLIMGPTGSGKTSLLLALLGEMHFIPSAEDSWFNLPRQRGVAYAAQEAWVLNETIKDNILFGLPYNEQRYHAVLKQCALEQDLSMFSAGDLTEVGERGITLSGGQKARISLARAIYSNAEVVLLDDVLAALDVHTAKWIVDQCFSGDLLTGRTVILVTHNTTLVKSLAQYIVTVKDGTAVGSGVTNADGIPELVGLTETETEATDVEDPDSKANGDSEADGKLILAEEIQIGRSGWSSVKMYTAALAGDGGRPISTRILFFLPLTFTLVSSSLGQVVQIWYLGYWSAQFENNPPEEVRSVFHLNIYALIFVLYSIMFGCYFILFVIGGIRASVSIHARLVASVFGATLRWLETTPVSRIITRFTQDIRSVDDNFPRQLSRFIELSAVMIFRLLSIIFVFQAPLFILPCILVTSLGVVCGMVYLKAQIPVKREMSNAKAPVLGHVNAAFADLTSIRAYSAQEAFISRSLSRIDVYARTARVFYDLQRWVGVRTDVLSGIFAACVAWYILYVNKGVEAGNSGFSLNMAGNSMERITHYLNIEQEPKPTKDGVPPAYWPTTGELRVENLKARYSLDGPDILKGFNFEIRSGERIGVVGRTGSGKSTLTLALLRCIPTDGEVYYDGLPTSRLNLDALRDKITIIPQSPELISGTLRHNLDPFAEHDDHTLNDALISAGLHSLQKQLPEDSDRRITLDTIISSGGANLSVGQRQIIALARALVRRTKVLILDEATSAIDYETDTIIQSSLKHNLPKDVTVIIVAHRLQTVVDVDRIMVLDAGQIVEFDSPKNLIQKEGGYFKALVEQWNGKEGFITAMQ